MKRFVFLGITLLLSLGLSAAISDYYNFSSEASAYTEITGTAQTTAQGDDVLTGAIDIGFDFIYGLDTYTQIKICSNGYITLGTTPGQINQNDLESTTYCPVIAGLWDDLHTGRTQSTTNPATSSVQTLMTGTEPHRKFIVQYKNAYWDYFTDPHNSYCDFQIILNENKVIEIMFGPNSGSNPRPEAGASIGINMLPGGAGNFWSVTPGSPPTASTTAENDTIRTHIASGTLFRFTPTVPNDLAATSIVGDLTASLGVSTEYLVTVQNVGINFQGTYNVKLMTGTVELASATGPSLQPGQSELVSLLWTPSAVGQFPIFGKVVLTGDQNTQNDQTSPITVLVVNQNGTLAGYVRNQNNIPLMGATVTAGTNTANTNAQGIYNMSLIAGTYSVTVHKQGFQDQTVEDVVITGSQTTVLNFNLSPVPNDDNINNTPTLLKGNYPNPLRHFTTINYSVKRPAAISISIYNIRGQLVKDLFYGYRQSGDFSVDWNATDTSGKQVPEGIYLYRMRGDGHSQSRYLAVIQ